MEDAVYTRMGGKLETPEAPAAFVQISSHKQSKGKKVAPPETPETWGAYKPAGGKSGGVVALMDMLQQDLKSDMAQSKHDEETAQKEYDDLMVESKETRQQNSKSIVDKEANKAQLEGKLEEAKQKDAMNGEQLMNVQQRLGDI